MLSATLAALLHGPYALMAAVVALVAAVGSVWGRRRSWLDRLAVALFVGYAVVATAALLTPARDGGAPGCDFSNWLPPDPATWATATPATVAMGVCLPVGALSLLADPARRATTMAVGFALPVVVELVQALLPGLGRGCSSAGLVASELGVMGGYFVGAVLLLLLAPLRGRGGTPAREAGLDSLFT